jgi:hypothetical protein
MRFRVTLLHSGSGKIIAECPEFSGCRVEAVDRADALSRIRNAIAYYREMCPCDVTSDAGIELEVTEDRA